MGMQMSQYIWIPDLGMQNQGARWQESFCFEFSDQQHSLNPTIKCGIVFEGTLTVIPAKKNSS
jgi:hypothetical protein